MSWPPKRHQTLAAHGLASVPGKAVQQPEALPIKAAEGPLLHMESNHSPEYAGRASTGVREGGDYISRAGRYPRRRSGREIEKGAAWLAETVVPLRALRAAIGRAHLPIHSLSSRFAEGHLVISLREPASQVGRCWAGDPRLSDGRDFDVATEPEGAKAACAVGAARRAIRPAAAWMNRARGRAEFE
jgi:hypothetical protein